MRETSITEASPGVIIEVSMTELSLRISGPLLDACTEHWESEVVAAAVVLALLTSFFRRFSAAGPKR